MSAEENKMRTDQKIRNSSALGNNIRILRKEKELTQEQMVARLQLYGLGISRSILSQMECGTYNIRVSELVAMSEVLNTDINSFFKGIQVTME